MILSKLAEILKPRIRKKLFEENDTNSKKSKLDIYRDSSFRFGYYFRSLTYQHSILLKSREFIHPVQRERSTSEKDDSELTEKDIKPDLSSSLKVHYEPFSIFGKSLVVIVEPYPLPGPSSTENTSPSTPGLKGKSTPSRPRPEKPLFLPDDDEEALEDINFDLDNSSQSRQTLLSQLIKDPTSDRQLDRKSQPQSFRLDDFLVPDSASKNSTAS